MTGAVGVLGLGLEVGVRRVRLLTGVRLRRMRLLGVRLLTGIRLRLLGVGLRRVRLCRVRLRRRPVRAGCRVLVRALAGRTLRV
ncbi:hypothetical protein ACFV4M_00070 [Kitasatospora indigofera]|uniref:hypothetical protein n=1 Tax=Kitasatospora indigofera TaxID=67307 RepID=UPI00365A4C91